MSLIRCPHCTLPMTETEASAGACPACQKSLRVETPATAVAAGGESLATVRTNTTPVVRNMLWTSAGGLAAVLLLVGSIVYLLSNPTNPDSPVDRDEKKPVQRAKVKPKSPASPGHKALASVNNAAAAGAKIGRESASQLAMQAGAPDKESSSEAEPPLVKAQDSNKPATSTLVKSSSKVDTPKADIPKPGTIIPPNNPVETRKPPVPPVVVAKPDPQPPQGDFVDVRKLDNINGEYVLDAMNGEDRIKLTGKVGTLKIGAVNAAALLDATTLQAKHIIITEGINGNATVKIHAPGATVEFHKDINGSSRVEVYAPGGVVKFAAPHTNLTGPNFNGDVKVKITARDVVLNGAVHGSSKVEVTLTRDGRLKFAKLTGGVRLLVRSAEPDATPIIEAGEILEGAKLEKVK